MDYRRVGAVLFVFISLLHFSNCEQITSYNHADHCTKITVKITADIVYPLEDHGKGTVKVNGSDFSKEDSLSYCDDGEALLYIAWKTDFYSLTLDFTENDETWDLSSIRFEYITSDNSDFNNSKIDGDTLETNITGITEIDLGNSYRCLSDVTYNLTSQDSTVQLTLTDLQVQAFNFTKEKEFGKSKDCPVTSPVNVNPNASCIRIVMRINNISITYHNTSGNETEVEATPQANDYDVTYDNCKNLTSQGNSRHAKITIGWPLEDNYYNLSISFSANYKKGEQGWDIGGMSFGYKSYNNPNFVAPQEESALLSFSKDFTDDDIALTRSYKCDKTDHYHFTSGSSPNSSATITLSFIQMQAFQFSDPKMQAFGSAVECDQAGTPVIVPILVGAALGLFVVILLLAYVVGRVRQRRAKSGYSRL